MDLTKAIVALYRKVATSLPPDVEEAMRRTIKEEDPPNRAFYEMVLENITLARAQKKPICQDTGIPIFFVRLPEYLSQQAIHRAIIEATRRATQCVPLRPNAVNPITGENSSDNTGRHYPIVYFEPVEEDVMTVDLLLKGGGSENVSRLYKLPDEHLNAGRDLEGVRRCVLDALWHAQGKGCPPYTVAVVIGGAIDQVSYLGKKLLLRRYNEENPDPALRDFE
ncbi:MAG: fumarate hydratase, partial [Nitrospirae bacterium]